MGRKWNPDSIPDSSTVPVDTYRVKIESCEEVEGGTKGGENAKLPAGCLMYMAEFAIVEPAAFAGLHLRDRFVIGSAADPDARDPKTWDVSIGAKQLKKLLKAARITITEDLDESCQHAVGNDVIAFVTTDKSGMYNEVKRYHAVGEREVGTGANGTAIRPAPAAPRVQPVPPPVPIATPVGATKAQAKPAAKAKPVMVPCPTCNVDVPRDAFVGHMDEHEKAEEQASA